MKKMITAVLIAAMLLSLAGCAAGKRPPDTMPPATSAATEQTVPQTEPPVQTPAESEDTPPQLGSWDCEPSLPDEEASVPPDCAESGVWENQFLRLRDISQAQMDAFQKSLLTEGMAPNQIPSLWVTDVRLLSDILLRLGSETAKEDCAIYDDGFFQTHGLLLIPRITTSGSVRHSAALDPDGTSVWVTAELPEVGTADMTNWLLLVPIERTENGPSLVTAFTQGGYQPMPGADLVME